MRDTDLDSSLAESTPQMHILSHLIVMHGDQARDSLINTVHLDKRHLPIFLKEFEVPHRAIITKQIAQLLLLHARRNIRQMQRLRGRKYIIKVL